MTHDPVQWRVDAMRAQITVTALALPFLVARPHAAFGPDTCSSCGDVVGRGSATGAPRCPACVQATQIVASAFLDLIRGRRLSCR